MDTLSIIGIAISLAMDAFAVSVTCGILIKKSHLSYALLISFMFGFFQGLMPFIGWICGNLVNKFINNFAHWISFSILIIIGSKMIYESVVITEVEKKIDPTNFTVILGLSVATSIDALAAGVSLAFLSVDILNPILSIAFITFVLSFLGFFIGKKCGSFLENKLEVVGGVVLIIIGIKILIQGIF